MRATKRHRLLLCTNPEMVSYAHWALGDKYDYDICLNLAEACAAIHKKPDLVMCNLHFDEGRMFDVLAYIRAHTRDRRLPFILVQTRESLTPAMIRSIETASRTIGMDAFLEVFRWRQSLSIEETRKKILDAIDRALAGQR